MHTRCCEELWSQNIEIPAGKLYLAEPPNIENIPGIVEVRFKTSAPANSGTVKCASGMWNGQEIAFGNYVSSKGSADIVAEIGQLGYSGFTAEFPNGLGRGIAIFNGLDVDVVQCFVSVRYKFTAVEQLARVKGQK